VPREVLRHTRAGIEGPTALAKKIGCRVRDIENAAERIRLLAEQLMGREKKRAGVPS
jgi:hypothetical protein